MLISMNRATRLSAEYSSRKIAVAICVPIKTARIASEKSSASRRAPAKTRPATSTPTRRTERSVLSIEMDGAVISPLLILLPRSAHEAVADDVEDEGHHEEEE